MYVYWRTLSFFAEKVMLLSQLLDKIEYKCEDFRDGEVKNLCYDSRKAGEGSLFVCLSGTFADGHEYIPSAYEKGCRMFAVSKLPQNRAVYKDAVFLKFSNTRKALALLSAAYFGHPAKELTVIGITGTKGKTSISYMMKYIFEAAGKKVGVVGTTGIFYGDFFEKSDNSTPESYELQKHFRAMADCGVDVCVMEVSSQGLMMHRTYGVEFDGAIYTNLSPDHIGKGEHSSYEEYRDCKSMLFAQTKSAFANVDDPNSGYVTAPFEGRVIRFGVDGEADFFASDLEFSSDDKGLHTKFKLNTPDDEFEVKMNIPGRFSVYNALAAATCALHFGVTAEDVVKGLYDAVVIGRMQKVDVGLPYTVIIDYAHNELSMEKLFETVGSYPHNKVITLFGCGGNRSKVRRYDLGYISAKYSDLCVITSDNPRFERLCDINEDIKVGLDKGVLENPRCETVFIDDRKEAMIYAMDYAKKGDIVLITGKGHQHYDEVNGAKIPFFEEEIIKEYAAKLHAVK